MTATAETRINSTYLYSLICYKHYFRAPTAGDNGFDSKTLTDKVILPIYKAISSHVDVRVHYCDDSCLHLFLSAKTPMEPLYFKPETISDMDRLAQMISSYAPLMIQSPGCAEAPCDVLA